MLEAYLRDAASVVDSRPPQDLVVVHTAPCTGAGTETVRYAFIRAGLAAPQPVPSQVAPDPASPTMCFSDPEEPGAMDASVELAEQTRPDLVIANDPMPIGAQWPCPFRVGGGCCVAARWGCCSAHTCPPGWRTPCSSARSRPPDCSRRCAQRPGCGCGRRADGPGRRWLNAPVE
ncbi:MAG: hypothetical protein ACRCXL_02050 [Dermatophilaceae bacterium]